MLLGRKSLDEKVWMKKFHVNLHSYLQLISLILSSSLKIVIQTKSSEALGFFQCAMLSTARNRSGTLYLDSFQSRTEALPVKKHQLQSATHEI